MSTAVMALAETSKSYRKRVDELEAEVARLQAYNEQLNHSFGIYDIGAAKDAERIAGLQKDLAQAQGYGHGLWQAMRECFDGDCHLKSLPKPPWLDGQRPDAVGDGADREDLGRGV